VNWYKMSCGHWQGDVLHWETGAPHPCYRCGTTRTTIIGWARPLRQGGS